MGSCFGRCLPKSSCRNSNSVDFNFLIEENTFPYKKSRGFLDKWFLRRKSKKGLQLQKPVLELVDDMLNPHLSYYNRLSESQQLPSTSSCHSNDIPLQSLDARALLAKTTVSTPASSLDLEWEHEIVQPSMVPDTSGSSWTAFGDDNCSESSTRNTAPACNSESWSRISSANSLEWDSVHNSLNPSPPASEIDNDTQVLLNEIERLTSQTLQETGRDLIS
ncbi:uncharacterized protein [Atheta coriaria]|uniref:uncharacterized protein n=1 Tax=Dalotia coriaria TaxID=877792 RepID=UPI0031F40824